MKFSEKYQNLINKINDRIPIKWLTGPIDKIFPTASLFLFIIIVLLILFLIFRPITSSPIIDKKETYFIAIADNNNNFLSNFEFNIKNLNESILQTYRTNESGKFTIELNKSGNYTLIVEQKGYKYKEQALDLTKTNQNIIVEISDIKTTQNKTLQFIAPDGTSISEELNVTISCQDPSKNVVPSSRIVKDGYADFELPLTCENFVARATSDNYEANNILFTYENSIITLKEKEILTYYGQARVTVTNNNNPLDGIIINIYEINDTINPEVIGQTQYGVKRFSNLPVGDYVVIANDDQLRYQSTRQEFRVEKNTETNIAIELNLIGNNNDPQNGVVDIKTRDIKVIIKDEETNQEITTEFLPRVMLIVDENTTIITKPYEENGIMFKIEEGKNYSLTAKADDYLSLNKTIVPNVNEYIIYLEKITESNVSNINVFIKDEDNLPVSNATLWIYNSATSYIDTRFSPIITDANGYSEFENIPKGDYFIKLRKTKVLESSKKFTHLPPSDTNQSLSIIIGEGTLNLNIKNNYDEALDFSNITIYNITGEEIGLDQADQMGNYNKKLKADKVIYAKISKDGHYDYYTELIPIIKNETITKNINLYKTGYTSTTTAELVGLYNEEDTEINYFTQNKKHNLKFRIIAPNQGNLGLRFLIGEKNNVLEDIVFIKPVTDSISNTIYYSDVISTRVLEGEQAKMIDTIFTNVSAGVYELTIPIQTKNAVRGMAIPIYYSVYTSTAPEPANLGNQKLYYIDVTEICSENFCIKGQFVDLENDISYDLDLKNNSLVINREYILDYEIINATNVYSNNRLRVENIENNSEIPTQAINFLDYSIFGANFLNDVSNFSGGATRNAIPFYTDYLTSQTINIYDKIRINTKIKPVLLGKTKIQNKIISNQSVIYNNKIDITVSHLYPFTISYEPENIVPRKPFTLKVIAIDGDNMPIENAIVNVYQKRGQNQLISLNVGQSKTNEFGIANVSMPALKNAEKILISVEKSSYYSDPLEIEINENILQIKQDGKEVTPSSPFYINVHKTNPEGSRKKITIFNRTDYALTIDNFTDQSFSFSNPEYLNITKSLHFLNSQIANLVIPANGQKDIDIEMSASNNTDYLRETTTVVGTIVGKVKIEGGVEYPFEIPINVQISIGEGVEEDNCLQITDVSNPWQAILSSNNSITQTFEIYNNCKIKGTETTLILKNIRAKISNEKDIYGSYLLTVDGKSITLSENTYITIFNDLAPGKHNAIIKYTPGNKISGDVKTKIYINAQVETNDGLKYVNSTSDPSFISEIAIRKIQDCFDFYDDSKKINNQFIIPIETNVGEPKELTIKNNCSDLGNFKLEFCENKQWGGCQDLRYENMEGPFQNEVEFNRGNSSEVIGIYKPTTPGGYIIPVKISILGDTGRVIASIEKRLKVNSQAGSRGNALFMVDPFIELEKIKIEGEDAYKSQIVRLLNKDINTTPWDYAQKKAGGEGFSKYMAPIFDYDYYKTVEITPFFINNNLIPVVRDYLPRVYDTYNVRDANNPLDIMLFENIDMHKEVQNAGLVPALGTAIGAIGLGWQAGLTAGIIEIAAITVSAAALPYFIIVGGVVGIGLLLSPTFFSDVTLIDYYQTVNLEEYRYSEETLKTIEFKETESEFKDTTYLNIFDITGAKYINYLKSKKEISGKIVKDKTYELISPRCDSLDNQELLYHQALITKTNNYCDSSLKTVDNSENSLIYSINCDGAWPRHKIDLELTAYTFCKKNESFWPEQAGIKPLDFIIKANEAKKDYQDITKGDIIYKDISFLPTLNDKMPGQDQAFVGSEPIGAFRFAFMSKLYPNKPEGDTKIFDCFSDSGKIGTTGEDALPKIKLDWSWPTSGLDIEACSTGEKYCDATQLSQIIVERMKKVNDLLKTKQISCPKSNSQILDQAADGGYFLNSSTPNLENEVPAGYVGLKTVEVGTANNLVKIKVNLENRTDSFKTGKLNIKLGNHELKAYEELSPTNSCSDIRDYSNKSVDNLNLINTELDITIPNCAEENTAELIFTYGDEKNPIIEKNLKLEIEYLGTNTYIYDSTQTYYTTDINLEIYEAQPITSCQVPATTVKFNGVDYIDMWFNEHQYPENVVKGWDIEDIKLLNDIIEFDAYLITDNYNKQFQMDFDKAFGGKMSSGGSGAYAFLGAPDYYQNGIYSKLFRDKTEFYLKYSENSSGVNILTPGKYRIRMDLVFNNDKWEFVNILQDVDVNAMVTFTYLSRPETNDSVFYRIPFNGPVGLTNTGYSRQNYGVAYLGDEITISMQGNRQGGTPLKTEFSSNSNPKKYLNVQFNKDFTRINTDIETRGNVLTIKEREENQIDLIYSPSYPTPVLMSVENNNLLPFSAYYQVTDASGKPVSETSHLTIWNGVGDTSYYDFSGGYVSQKFINFYDRQTSLDEKISNSYALDWDNIARTGTVNLRTIFYTPYDIQNRPQKYKIASKSNGSITVKFVNDLDYTKRSLSKNLPTTSLQQQIYKIEDLESIFEKVKNQEICIVNSENGKMTEFFWNPNKIYKEDNIYTGKDIIGITN